MTEDRRTVSREELAAAINDHVDVGHDGSVDFDKLWAALPDTDSLAAAWAEAEAATEWGWIRSLTRIKDQWEVVLAFSDRTAIVIATGLTPAAALHALAASLQAVEATS